MNVQSMNVFWKIRIIKSESFAVNFEKRNPRCIFLIVLLKNPPVM